MFAEDLKRTEKMTVDDVFEQSAQKMREQGMSEIAISQFRHAYHVWASEKESAWIREDAVEPLHGVRSFHDVYKTSIDDKAVHAFAKTAFLKLNGGLGTRWACNARVAAAGAPPQGSADALPRHHPRSGAHRAHEAERASAGHVHELVPHFG